METILCFTVFNRITGNGFWYALWRILNN